MIRAVKMNFQHERVKLVSQRILSLRITQQIESMTCPSNQNLFFCNFHNLLELKTVSMIVKHQVKCMHLESSLFDPARLYTGTGFSESRSQAFCYSKSCC